MKKLRLILVGLLFLPILCGCPTNHSNQTTQTIDVVQTPDHKSASFNISDLSKYKNAAFKTLSKTDTPENANMQIMGTNDLAIILGTQSLYYQTHYVYMGQEIIEDNGQVKWGYICPPSWKGRCKGQITYKDNKVMRAGKAGDILIVIKKSETDIAMVVLEKDGKYQKELFDFLKSDFTAQKLDSQGQATIEEINQPILRMDTLPDKTWVRIYFTPGTDCEENIIKQINQAKKMDIAVYSITNEKIVDALVNAKGRGAKVRVITDRLQSKGKYSLVSRLEREGFDIKTNIKHKIMHHKFAIFDGKEVETGSYNWTSSATKSNAENCMFFKQPNKEFSVQFDYLWDYYK